MNSGRCNTAIQAVSMPGYIEKKTRRHDISGRIARNHSNSGRNRIPAEG